MKKLLALLFMSFALLAQAEDKSLWHRISKNRIAQNVTAFTFGVGTGVASCYALGKMPSCFDRGALTLVIVTNAFGNEAALQAVNKKSQNMNDVRLSSAIGSAVGWIGCFGYSVMMTPMSRAKPTPGAVAFSFSELEKLERSTH